LRKDLDDECTRSLILVKSHDEELKKLNDANTLLLLEEIASIQAASAPEREAAAEEIESLKFEVRILCLNMKFPS
jgi:hypothetical protein